MKETMKKEDTPFVDKVAVHNSETRERILKRLKDIEKSEYCMLLIENNDSKNILEKRMVNQNTIYEYSSERWKSGMSVCGNITPDGDVEFEITGSDGDTKIAILSVNEIKNLVKTLNKYLKEKK